MGRKSILIISVIVIILAVLGVWWWQGSKHPGKYDAFTQCLDEKGAKFYGAFWCSHCQNQKAMFGNSKKHLPYIECSTPDSRSQLQVCRDAGIKVYPTWKFSDGSIQEGEVTLAELSEKTGCSLP